jgi:hypothetical protein
MATAVRGSVGHHVHEERVPCLGSACQYGRFVAEL